MVDRPWPDRLRAWPHPVLADSVAHRVDAETRLDRSEPTRDPVGDVLTWWRGDPIPDLLAGPGPAIGPMNDERLVAAPMGIDVRAPATAPRAQPRATVIHEPRHFRNMVAEPG